MWAGRGTPHILDTFFSCEAIFAAVCVTVLVPGEATVRNISKKCCHKMALSLVIIVSFRKLLTYFAETKVSGEATVRNISKKKKSLKIVHGSNLRPADH